MSLQIDDFLHSFLTCLVSQLAAATPAVTLAYNGAGKQDLFRYDAPEAFCNDPYTVATPTGGTADLVYYAKPSINVQMMTRASSSNAGIVRAQAIFDAALAADGRPLRMQQIPGHKAIDNSANGVWNLVNVDWVQRPGKIGVDDRNRAMIVFNWVIGMQKIS